MNLNKILDDLSKYKSNDKAEVLANSIQIRLAQSLKTYYSELDKSLSYLYVRDNLKVMKKINED